MDAKIYYSFALLALLLILYLKTTRAQPEKKKARRPSPPSPVGLPIVGHLHLLKEPFHRGLQSLSYIYGPIFHLRLGRLRVLVISSPEAISDCFTRNDVVFANRPEFHLGEILGYNYSNHIWVSYSNHWRNLRRVAAIQALSSHRLQVFASLRAHEIQFVARKALTKSGQKVDLGRAFSEMTWNIAMKIVCGRRWTAGPEDKKWFAPLKLMTAFDYFPVLRWLGCYKRVEKVVRDQYAGRDRVVSGLLEEARKANGGGAKKKGTMVEDLLALQEEDPEYYTDDILKGNLVVTLAAGTDTSAKTAEWAMSLLLNHPAVLHEARTEIDRHVGTTRMVDDSDIPSLPYLQNIVNETLRLFPAIPLMIPHLSSADATVAGYHVDKGTVVLINAWALHRDPNLWDEPLAFRPQRFEGSVGYKFAPFGVGRRACPAMNMALRTIMLMLATWIHCFEFDAGEVDMEEGGTALTLGKSESLVATCRPRGCMFELLSTKSEF